MAEEEAKQRNEVERLRRANADEFAKQETLIKQREAALDEAARDTRLKLRQQLSFEAQRQQQRDAIEAELKKEENRLNDERRLAADKQLARQIQLDLQRERDRVVYAAQLRYNDPAMDTTDGRPRYR